MSRIGTSPGYVVRRVDIAAETAEILRLWLAAYPEMNAAYARAKLERQYLQTPAGPGICLLLEHGDGKTPVGVQCIGLRRFAYRNTSIRAGILADYVVDAGHRSLGPALTLLKGTLMAGNDAVALLYGFPNDKSKAVVRRAGMRSPGSVTRFARPLRSKSLLTRRLGPRWQRFLPIIAKVGDDLLGVETAAGNLLYARRWHWFEQDDFDEFFDDCWAAGRRESWLIGERSQETLNWRFPEESSRLISVAAERRSGTRQGYVVWRRTGNEVQILDVFCRQAERQLTGLLAGFANRTRKLGAESISLEFAGPARLVDAVRKAGFRPRDQHPLFVSADEDAEINSLPLESMYLTGFDRD